MLVNQTEFARLHNVSRKTVTKWKSQRWLVFEGDLVDVEKSNELIKRYRAEPVTQVVTSCVTPVLPVTQSVTFEGVKDWGVNVLLKFRR